MLTITAVEVHDIRFPTSEGMHGSDAMHPDPDYSAAYVILRTNNDALVGHGLTFTIGRGTEIVVAAVNALSYIIIGKTLDSITSNFGVFWSSLVNDGQLRWLGPEKGVMHMAVGALVNAVWDLWGKAEGKPVWRLLFDLTPEQIVSLIDFRWITDALTPDEALAILKQAQQGKEERLRTLLAEGYQAYTTSAGWLGYTEEQLREKCRSGVAAGWTHFKAKVGVSLQEDMERIRIIREEIGSERTLMVDANQRWDVPIAIDYMKALSVHKPWFIEEPTCADDVLGHLAIKKALQPYGIKVATGEVCQNRVMFKQFLVSGAMDICQIDSCRVAGVNELIVIYLMAAKFKIPVCPHAGGVGLCEYVQHLAMFDYLCVSKERQIIEYVNHLHEHFKYPVNVTNGCYQAPMDPGYSIEMFPASLRDYVFPTGKEWVDRIKNKQSRQVVTETISNQTKNGAGLPTNNVPVNPNLNIQPVASTAASATSDLHQLSASSITTASAAQAHTSSRTGPVWLITGAQGFVGAAVIKALLADAKGPRVVAHDLKHDDRILAQVLDEHELAAIERAYCDISDSASFYAIVERVRPTYIIHLAGLQIPTCRANTALGAKVNVIGTVNVFDAAVKAKDAGFPIRSIVYASSAAALGPAEDYGGDDSVVPEDYHHRPRTQYGVFKLCNEGNARIFWQDNGIASVGLRPLTVFGVGREIGMTSAPTKAIKNAILNDTVFEIPFTGTTSFNDVNDVARLFIVSAEKCDSGAHACGIRGEVISVEQFMQTAESVLPALKGKWKISVSAKPLPFPSKFDDANLVKLLNGPAPQSSLKASIEAMVQQFAKLKAVGKLHGDDLK